jgi:perosamine synthetase
MKSYARFKHPQIDEAVLSSVAAQLHEAISIYDNGGAYARVEGLFKQIFGVENALAVNSGTTALLSMFYGAGIGPGDEVVVPSYTFFATCSPLLQLGARLRFADCTDNGNIDPDRVADLLTERTKAVVITHMWGIPCDMDRLLALRDEVGFLLLEDSSHAHGATWDGKMVGSFTDGSAWSFQGKKILTAGEGGFFATPHREFFERAVLLGHFNRRAKIEVLSPHLAEFATTGTGLNLRMHPLAAALLLPQMQVFDRMMREKREVAAALADELAAIDGLEIVPGPPPANPAWYALPVRFDPRRFRVPLHEFVAALNDAGAVEADVPGSTCPLNRYALFRSPSAISRLYDRDFDVLPEHFARAEAFAASMFKLDVWYGPERFNYVDTYISIIKSVARKLAR